MIPKRYPHAMPVTVVDLTEPVAGTLTHHLATARDALIEARRLALADAADATYQIARGRFTPLSDAAGTCARIDDLLHLTTRLLSHHGA